MDGDSRGGAALSVKEVSGRPIKFVGSGEKLEALEPFYPDRIASRILGMGAPASPEIRNAARLHKHLGFDEFMLASTPQLRMTQSHATAFGVHSLKLASFSLVEKAEANIKCVNAEAWPTPMRASRKVQ